MSMKIIRVFPRKTKATPVDNLVRINESPGLLDECDEVHISVAFTWDLPRAERLARQWRHVAPVKIGGPATGEKSGNFTPGMYIRHGYTITSRGCPNRCWFCSVWKREGSIIRELPIQTGNNILDDNLLACSDEHIKSVFTMAARQRSVVFTGGLEAKRLKSWQCLFLKEQIKPQQIFFAYDTPDDLEPLQEAMKMLQTAGWKRQQEGGRSLCCYVLCGWKKDTTEAAKKRMLEVLNIGMTPMAMSLRDKNGNRTKEWTVFQRKWVRREFIYGKEKKVNCPLFEKRGRRKKK